MTSSRPSGPPSLIVGGPLFAFLSVLALVVSFLLPIDRLASSPTHLPSFRGDATSLPVATMILSTDRDQLAAQLQADLEQVTVVSFRPRVLGYERERFGNGWAHSLLDGNYCDTRDHVLQLAFTPAGEQSRTEGSAVLPTDTAATTRRDCDIPEDLLKTTTDPYTGKVISTSESSDLDIDHLFPLAAAWDLGAYRWENAQRRQFANDITLNLVATDSATNREKSDATLGEWLPPEEAVRCGYAAAFVDVAHAYSLAITQADAATARKECNL